ncbi:ribokinase [Palleronia aestuarii]|uniref:Ribokinase n=1 Tax=Palleronia aestuarii TaxID=568105 RepID=A0A2W7NA47_9RHOB|nr:ribokinase [Palleronia aestuarii]PZX16513.1 ribokinase [Palleronia aestuarii]
MSSPDIVILGIFVADTTYRAERQPRLGETILGRSFSLGPGGKGSNQAVAAARAGGHVGMITRLGRDVFADMALDIWREAGVTSLASTHDDGQTGAAFIFVDDVSGDNAIIVTQGIAAEIGPEDLDARRAEIQGAKVFLTQLEQPLDAAHQGLAIAREGGVQTILNPAPATELPDAMLALCDVLTPNETEAEALTGIAVSSVAEAERAADTLLAKGVGAVIVTLGERGALYRDATRSLHVEGLDAGPVAETTGAGDAFNGALAVAFAEGLDAADAVRFANATAALSVTRSGAAASMPDRAGIDALLERSRQAE